MKNKIVSLSEKYYERVRDIRHLIHMYPEEGFKEHKTSELIISELEKLGIEVQSNIAKTGVVGLIRGKEEGKTVLLRADMDALKVEEKADVEYKSKIPGVMHACGHDGHVAGLLGAAMILNELKDEIKGNVKLVFQPAEEIEGGAKPMIDEGVLNNPKVYAAFGAHLLGSVKEGQVRTMPGPMMAAPDIFSFKVIGVGGHGAVPQSSIDPIVITCQIVSSLQTIISRRLSPLTPAVITCGKIQGGNGHNIIPNEVEVEGTIRTFDRETREAIPKMMEEIIRGMATCQGATYEFNYEAKYPSVINDIDMTNIVMNSLGKIAGEENVDTFKEPMMGGEDFAYFAQEVPACFFFVGIAEDESKPVLHHNPYFKFSDENLKLLSSGLSQVAIDYLNI